MKIRNLVRKVNIISIGLEKFSDYLARRAAEVEHGGCVARRGHYYGLHNEKGCMVYHFIRPLTKLELNLSFPLLDRIDDQYQISEIMQMLTAYLAHPFFGERITKEENLDTSWWW